MIKAIETRYKGYRFRSRLEARWAVAFETAGVSWTYEHEGFDLGSAGWYLPDFFLDFGRGPGSNPTVEIKPLSACPSSQRVDMPRVYMAGSMRSGEGWRGIGVTSRGDRLGSVSYVDEWEASNFVVDGSFVYVGPFSIADDHGCAHGTPHMAFDCGNDFYGEPRVYRHELIEVCLQAIGRCDVFAAYIDRPDCFGTLVEIGMAKALGKRIWVGICPDIAESLAYPGSRFEGVERSPKDHEMWFAQDLADYSVIVRKESAAASFRAFIDIRRKNPQEIEQAIALAALGQTHYVVYGDPIYCRIYCADSGRFLNDVRCLGINDYAANVARSARFEHGECPA